MLEKKQNTRTAYGVYVYEVGKNGGKKKDLRRYTEMWKLSGICTCLYIYICIYLC